jgi:FlaA1/EpsC-like NDP-sugar epimerase
LIVVAFILFAYRFVGFARSIFIIDWVLTILLIYGLRLAIRLRFWIGSVGESALIDLGRFFRLGRNRSDGAKNLLIIGAGDCGEMIYREIQDNARLHYNVVGFIDDDTEKVGMKIHGVPVLGITSDVAAIASKMKAEELLIAIPSSTGMQMRRIVARCEESGIPYKTAPGIGELIDGKVTVKAIRDVSYHDLLGREVIRLDEDCISGYLKGSRILVTGAGGSIGSELCARFAVLCLPVLSFMNVQKALSMSFLWSSIAAPFLI